MNLSRPSLILERSEQRINPAGICGASDQIAICVRRQPRRRCQCRSVAATDQTSGNIQCGPDLLRNVIRAAAVVFRNDTVADIRRAAHGEEPAAGCQLGVVERNRALRNDHFTSRVNTAARRGCLSRCIA